MSNHPQKPRFIVDPSGNVRDLRPPKSAQASGAAFSQAPRAETVEQGQASQLKPQTRQKSRYTPYLIPIPVGLIISILIGIYRLFTPSTTPVEVNHPGSTFFNMGNYYFNQGNYDQAIFQFNIALNAEPTYGEAYNNRGLAYHAKGDNDKALADFEKAIQFSPNLAFVHSNKGLVYFEKNDFDQALSDFNRALELDPELAKAYYNRGVTYLNLRNFDKAIADLDKTIQLTSRYGEDPTVDKQGTVSPEFMGMLNGINNSQSFPDLSLAYATRGTIFFSKADLAKAAADFDRAIGLRPRFALAYYDRGLMFYSSGDFDKAIADFKKVLELNNDPATQTQAKARLDALGIK